MDSFNKTSFEIDIKILSQLIAADNMLHIFTSDRKLGEFVTRALKIVPGVASCGMCIYGISGPLGDFKENRCHTCTVIHEDSDHILRNKCSLMEQEDIYVFSLETLDRLFGFLVFKIDSADNFASYEPFLRNFANSATINMENRWQKERLGTANEELNKYRDHLEDVNRQLHQEIAERKQAEEHIKASLREKEVLLREIHHRVKNNLAVISSLLNMQANKIKDQHVHAALQESQNRVRAMALIHETLYQSESLALVALEGYVKGLVGNIVSVFDGSTRGVSFEVKMQDVKLEADQAVPCGLIINELVTNALKHAFVDGKDGIVWINADYVSEKEIELSVSDNGIGIPEGLDWRKSQSLGLRLISLMVEQLHGTWEINNNQGTEITIRWPLYNIMISR